MLVYSTSWFNLPLLEADGKDAMERFPAAEQRFGVHGGQVETSMMLALKPRLVRQSRFKSFASTSEQRARDYPTLGNGRSAKLAWAAQDLNPEGAAGSCRRRRPGGRPGPDRRRRPRAGHPAARGRSPAGQHAAAGLTAAAVGKLSPRPGQRSAPRRAD
jgi:hypothetical protein